jgi:precorrin isomerase
VKHDSFIPIALENSLVKPANQDLLTDGTDPIADVTQALQWAAESEKDDVLAYFDPDDDTVTRPPETVPARSWKMSDETRRWVIVGHSPAEQASLLKQIAEAEEKRKMRYIISVPSAFYEIEYGRW